MFAPEERSTQTDDLQERTKVCGVDLGSTHGVESKTGYSCSMIMLLVLHQVGDAKVAVCVCVGVLAHVSTKLHLRSRATVCKDS